VIAQKFDPAGGVSFCTHDHEIIPQSGPMELKLERTIPFSESGRML
jgi:hypothetical protein